MTIIFGIIFVLAISGAVIYYLKHKAETSPVTETPLPKSTDKFPRIFAPWSSGPSDGADENVIAKHDMYWNTPEAYDVTWLGRTTFTAPAFVGKFEPSAIATGLAKRDRLKALNPDIKLLVQIGFAEGADATTDFPPDHPFWLRENHLRVSGYFGPLDHRFDVGNAAYRTHIANCCKEAMNTGIWDGIMLDVFFGDDNHVDLLRKIRAQIGNALIVTNCNYNIYPNVAPLVNGIFMECGIISKAPDWVKVQDALDYYERHVKQPSVNCLEISGWRADIETMRCITCLMLARGNGYVLMADPGQGFASTHKHEIYTFWTKSLGSPLGSPMSVGTRGSRREYERGTAVFNPPGGNQITLTFSESRLNMGTGFRSTEHILPAHDGGIYVK